MIFRDRPVRFVTVERFCDFSGYTPDAVRSKIKRGDWLEGAAAPVLAYDGSSTPPPPPTPAAK